MLTFTTFRKLKLTLKRPQTIFNLMQFLCTNDNLISKFCRRKDTYLPHNNEIGKQRMQIIKIFLQKIKTVLFLV